MDDVSSTYRNITCPWTYLSMGSILGVAFGSMISLMLVTFPLTQKLVDFYVVTIAILLLLPLFLGSARSLGAPKQITINSLGIFGTISYPRWSGRGVRTFSVLFSSIIRGMRWIPGWTVSMDIPAVAIYGRLYVTVSNANALRIRRTWEQWKAQDRVWEKGGSAGSRP